MSRVVVVCPVLPYPPLGGGHKRTLRLIEAIDRAGGVPHLVTSDPGTPGAADSLRSRGWTVDVVEERTQTRAARARQHVERRPSPFLPAVAARLGELAPQAAFVQFESPQSAYYWREVTGKHVVLSMHNVDSEMLMTVARGTPLLSAERLQLENRWRSMRHVERQAAARADTVLCVSQRDRRYFERYSRNVVEVPNGVDDDFFEIEPELPDNEDILFFGQFDYLPNRNGMLRFLRDGWPALAAARPAARLKLAGKGMEGQLAREAGAAERVEAVGFVADLGDQLSKSRLVIVPLWQGGGTRLKVLEALAAARPVVGTPLGVEELGFEHDRHGLVGADPAELARLSAAVLADRERSLALARNGRELADRYRWARVTAPAETLYRNLLTG